MANEERAKALYDSILSETKRPTVAGKTFEYDTFKKYDTRGDAFVDAAIVKQKDSLDVTENALNRKLAGQTIVTAHQHYLEKTSAYWRKWKSDNDTLEYISMQKVKSPPKKKKKPKLRPHKVSGKVYSFPREGSFVPSPYPVNGPTSVKYMMGSTEGRRYGGVPSKDRLMTADEYDESGNLRIDSSSGYGLMSSSARQRPKTIPPVAANSDTPLDADNFLRPSIGNRFQISKRFPDSKKEVSQSEASPFGQREPSNTLPSYSGKFMMARRDPPLPGDQPRGPGEYPLPSFLDEAKRDNRGAIMFSRSGDTKDMTNSPKKVSKHNNFMDLTPAQYCKEVSFGFGCSVHEHILYGMCLDGMCGKRAFYENIMLHHADNPRMRGDREERERLDLLKELHVLEKETKLMEKDVRREDYIGSSGEETQSMGEQDNSASLTPLHVAAHKSDLETIKTMGRQEFDIDAVESTHGRTAVHIAVVRNNQDALKMILDVFKGRINLNIQDNNGDTPLHLACRSGVELMVEYLCDFDANPVHAKNNLGKWPVDYARTHKTYQVLHLTEEKQKAEQELRDVQEIRQKVSTGALDPDDISEDASEKQVTSVGTKLVADKEYVPTFKELDKKDLWNKRPNRSQVMTLQQKLATLEATMT